MTTILFCKLSTLDFRYACCNMAKRGQPTQAQLSRSFLSYVAEYPRAFLLRAVWIFHFWVVNLYCRPLTRLFSRASASFAQSDSSPSLFNPNELL